MAIGTKYGFIPEEGTVIQATHAQEDLIPALTEELFLYRPSVTRGIKDEYADVYAAIKRGDLNDTDETSGADLVETLFNKLNEEAPEGMYFGAHPGNGSDFGFWKDEEEV